MQITVNVKELSQALNSIIALQKKMPAELSRTDAGIAILRNGSSEYEVVASYEWFSVSVKLPTATGVGDDMQPWTGGRITQNNVIGIVEAEQLGKILSKITNKKQDAVIKHKMNANHLSISIGGNQEYKISTNVPKKVLSNYGVTITDKHIASLDATATEDFISTINSLAGVITTSVSQPSFGCVCIDSFEKTEGGGLFIRMAGSSDIDGFSVIANTQQQADGHFTALLPKLLADSIKAFFKCFGNIETMDIGAVIGEDGKSKSLSFKSELFSLWLSCMTDEFPFNRLSMILGAVANPPVTVTTATSEFVKAISRMTIMASGDNSLTSISITDGGAIELNQYNNADVKNSLACEKLTADRVVNFPSDKAEVSTIVKTNILKKMIGFYHPDLFYVSLTINANGSNGKAIFSDGTEYEEGIASVQLGVKVK